MQPEFVANLEPVTHAGNHSFISPSQHGPLHHDPEGLVRGASGRASLASPRSEASSRRDSRHDVVDAEMLGRELRGLSLDLGERNSGHSQNASPGQRIAEYEKAMAPSTPRKALGFRVIKRSENEAPSGGIQLTDFPNETLMHIFSHLHTDSHATIALVSKRFYALITSSHAWRMAFLRYFPGHEALETKANANLWTDSGVEFVRSEARFFARMTPVASWRKEYLLRTRLLRSLSRGKPGASSAMARSGKKLSAVLTYNSKLPWRVTDMHAIFTNGKKPPRALQGSAHLGAATISDPTCGKIEKWGFTDPFSCMQLEEIDESLVPFGLGEGPAANPNVMEVSQAYGLLVGEGFPGGRAYFRSVQEMRGRYLDADSGVADTYPDIPKIPEMSEAICSVWLAKTSAVPSTTQAMIGMLTGSTLGVVTAYATTTGDSGGHRYSQGEMTARWVLSPGVPIVSLKIDDNYSQKRQSSARVWAVALNALGEVYYLNESPISSAGQAGEDVAKQAWYAGRTVYWHLLEATRRVARPDDQDKNATKGAYSPRTPSNAMNLTKSQMAAEAREIEKFLRHRPSHFRRVCEGWDMQRRLDVDFAGDDGQGAGENIFVLDCGLAEGRPALIQRFTRSLGSRRASKSVVDVSAAPELRSEPQPQPQSVASPSLFGSVESPAVDEEEDKKPVLEVPKPPSPTLAVSSDVSEPLHEWRSTVLKMKGQSAATITSSAMDCSSNAVLTLGDDPLRDAEEEIPGRRARMFAVGTSTGSVLVWNARDEINPSGIRPQLIMHTESPEISSIALTSLYIVHGGSDGLVQAWDPLASTMDPIRTINARSNGRVPRHMTTMNPTLHEDSYAAVGAICLDPDPTMLRGIVSFGAFMRYWSYSSTPHGNSRKRRLRMADVHGRMASRRQGGVVTDYIAAEEAEMRRENEQKAREQARLRNRFGVGALGDLTEEEALRYAQMVSEEAFMMEEQRRTSDSAADASLDTASTFSETTVDTVTPEPSVTGVTPPTSGTLDLSHDGYEQQIQQALRLSLLESGGNETGQSPPGVSSGEYEFSVTYKKKNNKRGKRSGPSSPLSRPVASQAAPSSSQPESRDDDLELALLLSLQDQGGSGKATAAHDGTNGAPDEFPPLDTEGVGKGKGVCRW